MPSNMTTSYLYRGIGMVVVVLGLMLFFYGYGNDLWGWILAGIGVLALSVWFLGRGQRYAIRYAKELLADDSRPPILYLRSFSDEATGDRRLSNLFSAIFGRSLPGARTGARRDEQATLAAYLNRIGPYITVGRPGEDLPEVGAAWLWIPDTRWKSEVGKLIKHSRLIVIQAGYSDGLRWEFEQLVKYVDPTRILLIVPKTKRDYGQFSDWITTILPKKLPQRIPPSLLIIFDKTWKPHPLPPGTDLFEVLYPFFRQNNIDAPPNVIQASIQDKKRK